ncbi:MAG: SMC-Scp complex subunit ScpB [Planctomycetota bacterium]|nr:MAG: SMC-Scp complex subunit ScpB [Planctomycetota bacterium]REK30688.1 MAG: SMC-Scp complex subunit ScpB [Planctomycetota bacterium]REK33063.1 MAG: SMC-Scp complex subunit ScpB [Planctomycetota bacterium]
MRQIVGNHSLQPDYRRFETSVGAQLACRLTEIERFWRRCRDSLDAALIQFGGGPEVRSPRAARLEAALFVADRPLSPGKLAQSAAIAGAKEVQEAVEELNDNYNATDSPFRVQRAATGYQLLTRPEFSPWLDKVHERHARLRLSPPAMETLAIVAYRQPILRADIEAIRGVMSGEMLKQLMERGLVKIVGEDDSLGRPYLYGTTRQFLELFGLHSLAELPEAETRRPQPPVPATVDEDDDIHLDDEDGDEDDEWDEDDDFDELEDDVAA